MGNKAGRAGKDKKGVEKLGFDQVLDGLGVKFFFLS